MIAALVIVVVRFEARGMTGVRLPAVRRDQEDSRRLYNQLRESLPQSVAHKRILALHDPYKLGFALAFLVQLAWNEHDVTVDTGRLLKEQGVASTPETYDIVIDYVGGKFVRADLGYAGEAPLSPSGVRRISQYI